MSIDTLWSSGRTTIAMLRAIAREAGPVAPVGGSNVKTASPGTYRAVGPTCPTTCPYLGNGCYAQGGPVAMAARRAVHPWAADVRAAEVAIVAALRAGVLARLHVSGDFASDGRVDHAYVHAIADVAARARELSGRRWVAWTYTHLPYGAWVDLLRDAGVHVRLSDRPTTETQGPGAIVVASETEARDRGAFVCPAQTGRAASCAECRACWQAPRTVAFLAHGASSRRAAEAAALVAQ